MNPILQPYRKERPSLEIRLERISIAYEKVHEHTSVNKQYQSNLWLARRASVSKFQRALLQARSRDYWPTDYNYKRKLGQKQ